jgi:hypothetical protein
MSRNITQADVLRIGRACAAIEFGRTLLRQSGADKAADYAQRCLKSAKGALRHAEGRYQRGKAPREEAPPIP